MRRAVPGGEREDELSVTIKVKAYIADRKINAIMAAADLCPPNKVFIGGMLTLSVKRKAKTKLKSQLSRIISESKTKMNGYWIPVITYNGEVFVANGIQQVSDGRVSCVLHKKGR